MQLGRGHKSNRFLAVPVAVNLPKESIYLKRPLQSKSNIKKPANLIGLGEDLPV